MTNKNRYFLGSVVILVALIGYFGFYSNLVSLNRQLLSLNDDNLAVAREGLEREISQVEGALLIIAKAQPVQNMDARQLRVFFSRIAKSEPSILNLLILDSRGKVVQSMVDRPTNYKLTDQAGVKRALTGQTNLSGLIYAKTNRTWIVSLKIPIFSDDAKIIGVAVATLSLDHLREHIESYPFENGAYLAVVDGTGKFIFQKDTNNQQNLQLSQVLYPRLKERTAGSFTIPSPVNGERTLYKYQQMGRYGWYIIMAQPLKPIYTELGLEALKVIGVIVLSIIVINLLLKSYELEKKKAEQEIENRLGKLELVGQLAAGVAHEIRNPLTTLKGFLQLMAMNKGHAQEIERLRLMLKEVEQIEHISEEFMSLAKPTAAVLTLCNLNTLVEDVVHLILNCGSEREVRIVKELSSVSPTVLADQGQLRQVAVNLLKNALEACDGQGEIVLKTTVERGQAILQVIDNGSGFPPEFKEKLGTPFFTTKENGTGLGLTVCFRIVQNLGGSLELESQPNQGTTVTVRLPLKIQ